jgi:sulfur-oxidizing protein SoxA
MLLKTLRVSVLGLVAAAYLHAGDYNAEAEKDRKELVKYFEAKFADPAGKSSKFFPYTTENELKSKYDKGLKLDDFKIGSYAYALDARETYEMMSDMPPFLDNVDAGEELYKKAFANGKSFKDCFPDPAISGNYPYYSDERSQVVTITQAINECLVNNGEKAWNPKKGKIADLEAYFANASKEADKKIDIKIQSQAAADAYARGKKEYYSQRGYLKMSCATCHVQGGGLRVKNEKLSPLLGQVSHFPVYRLKWGGLGTIERRLEGCEKDQGETTHKVTSDWHKEIIYFMSYMSNGISVDGPDIRK